jgi:restriction endonuclease S subunit
MDFLTKELSEIIFENPNLNSLREFAVQKLLFPSSSEEANRLKRGWKYMKLSECISFKAGKTPTRGESRYWGNGVHNWVSIADLIDGGNVERTKEKVSDATIKEVFSMPPNPAGTLIMSFKLTIGKISTLTAPAFTNEAIIAVHPNKELNIEYVKKILPILARSGDTKGALKGDTLNRQSLSSLIVPIPPLEEQVAIVKTIENFSELLFSVVSANFNSLKIKSKLIKSLTSDAKNLLPLSNSPSFEVLLDALPEVASSAEGIESLRNLVLQLAFMGVLTSDDSSEWKYEPLSEVGHWGAGSTPLKSNPAYYGGSNVWIRSGELMDKLSLKGSEIKISDLALRECAFKSNNSNDVLLAITGATIGKVAILAEPAVTNQHVLGCSPNGKTTSEFLYWYLRYLRPIFTDHSVGGAQPGLSKMRLEKLLIPIPEIARQNVIVGRISIMWHLLQEIETNLRKYESLKIRILKSSIANETQEVA